MAFVLRHRRLVALAATLAAALAVVGAAYALTSSSFTYSKAKTGYVVVGPLAIAPASDAIAGWTVDGNTGLTTNGGCFSAALSLPIGSKVKSLQSTFSSTTGAFVSQIWRTSLAAGSGSSITDANSSDSSGTVMTTTGSVATAKQSVSSTYAYGLLVCEGPGDHFYGAKVKYTYTSAGS